MSIQHLHLLACSLAEASVLLGFSRSKTRRLLKAKRIPGIRLGKTWRIPRQAIVDLSEGREWSEKP